MTSPFAAGQQVSAGIGADGKLNNVKLTDNAKGDKVGDYVLNGEKHTTLGDDMKALHSTYSGVFSNGGNEYHGSITANGDGEIVNVSGQLGKELVGKDINTFTVSTGESIHVGNETMEKMLRGDNDMWGAKVSKATITDAASYFTNHYMADTKNSESNIKAGLSSGLLKKIGIENDAYIAATDQTRADMINAAFQAKHEEISNSNMTNDGKAAARADYHQEVYNEYLQMIESSKLGRLVDQGSKEFSGAGAAAKKTADKVLNNLPEGNAMGMEDKDGKNWGD